MDVAVGLLPASLEGPSTSALFPFLQGQVRTIDGPKLLGHLILVVFHFLYLP